VVSLLADVQKTRDTATSSYPYSTNTSRPFQAIATG
jgi:hypothetical protein